VPATLSEVIFLDIACKIIGALQSATQQLAYHQILPTEILNMTKCIWALLIVFNLFFPIARADLAKGLSAYELEDFKAAYAALLPEAKAGNVEAQTRLAVMYYKGQGVSQNSATSVAWTKKAADQGDANSLFILSLHYRAGEGVSKDTKRAFELTEKAANLGHAPALNDMGSYYALGTDGIVKKDMKKALDFYTKAANAGYPHTQALLGNIYEEGTDVPADLPLAAQWNSKAAQNGHLEAMFNLAGMYKDGTGVKKSLVVASSLLTFLLYNRHPAGNNRESIDKQISPEGLALREPLLIKMAAPTKITMGLRNSGRPIIPGNLINAINEFLAAHPDAP
jgi:hypothetical protein